MRLLLLLCLSCLLRPALGQEAVRLQLKWQHAFQFAGYYAAAQLGYYREAGLAVEIVPGGSGIDSVREVVEGRAEYGVGNSSLLLSRQAGLPVVALAVIFQHSPAVLLTTPAAVAGGVGSLSGKRIMVEPHTEELLAYLRQEGLHPGSFTQVPHSLKVDELMSGKVAAITAYSTNEPWLLEQAGFSYVALSPLSRGIDFYGDNLFTTEDEIARHPGRVRAFRAASLRGWQYAMAHPDEVVTLMQRHYRLPHPRAFYLHEAQTMRELLRTDLIEIGYMNPVRWLHIADTYADLGLLPRGVAVQPLLYRPDPVHDYSGALGALAVAAGVAVLSLYVLRINRRLRRALAASQAAEDALRHLAQHDNLTGLPNRALFADRLEQALAAAVREQRGLALLFLDLDGFKPVNDALGHAAGDLLLQEVARRLLDTVRGSDTVARLGGDEFVLLLRSVDTADSALAVAAKIGDSLRQPYLLDGQPAAVSASIGIALHPAHGATAADLMRHADIAMYVAKQHGRDRVELYRPAAPV
nr:GGDEF domain-containing protein [Massilia sp. TS11]